MPEQLIIQNPEESTAEKEFIALSRQGDPVAFENLVKIHMKWAYGLAYRLSGEHFLADEISQEAFFCFIPVVRQVPGGGAVKNLPDAHHHQRLAPAPAGSLPPAEPEPGAGPPAKEREQFTQRIKERRNEGKD